MFRPETIQSQRRARSEDTAVGDGDARLRAAQDDSPWRDFVNRTLVNMPAVQENNFESRHEEICDRRFGRDGALYYPLDQSTRDYLSNLSIWMP